MCAWVWVALAGLLCPAVCLAEEPSTTNPPPKLVFAHYMVCFATYGETIAGYQREIREAQAAGIDGFALNVGAWSGPERYYKKRVALIYNAAEQLNTDFKLFFSIDLFDTNDIVDMVSTYSSRSNSFRQQGRLVLSTYGKNAIDWHQGVFLPLRNQGHEVFFIPFFWPTPVTELPNYEAGLRIFASYSNLIDGCFLFGAAGLPQQLADSNAAYTRAAREADRLFMAGCSPHYWGYRQPTAGRRYYEYAGGEGVALQWSSIITNNPDWVEIVTWNDFAESTYVAPVENPGDNFRELLSPRRYCHAGYLELMKRYIAWYKTGRETPIDRDALFYFYRTHPANVIATDTNEVPVTTRRGDVQDAIYLTLALTDAAQLEVSSGSRVTTNTVPAGLQHVRVPFLPGAQRFKLRRTGMEVLTVEGPPIEAAPQVYNFFPASGFAYRPRRLNLVENLRVYPN